MKKLVSVLVLIFLVLSLFTVAQTDVEEKSSCSGFWGSLSCFLWGNPENRAGRGWFERGNVVGEVAGSGQVQDCNGWNIQTGLCSISHNGEYYYLYVEDRTGPSNMYYPVSVSTDSSGNPNIAYDTSLGNSYPTSAIGGRSTRDNPGARLYTATQNQLDEDINYADIQSITIERLTPVPSINLPPTLPEEVSIPAPSPSPPAPTPAPAPVSPPPAPSPEIINQEIGDYTVDCNGNRCIYYESINGAEVNFNVIPQETQQQIASLVEGEGYIPATGFPGSAPLESAPATIPAPQPPVAPAVSSAPSASSPLAPAPSPVPAASAPATPAPAPAPATAPAPAPATAPASPNEVSTTQNILNVNGETLVRVGDTNYFVDSQGFLFDNAGIAVTDGTIGTSVSRNQDYNSAKMRALTIKNTPAPVTSSNAVPSPQPAPPSRPPGPPDGSQIDGTDYYLTLDGRFVDAKGKDAPSMDILLNPARPIITHDQAYAMLDARASQSESRVLAGLPGGTQVNYQGNTYQYNSQQRRWQTADNKLAPAELSAAVVQGQAQVTQPTILTGLSSGNFKIGDQQYIYSNGNWHTGGADGIVISAVDLQTKLLEHNDPTKPLTGEILTRVQVLKSQKDQIEKAKKARQQADSQMWAGSWFDVIQTSERYQDIKDIASTFGGIASFAASGGKYQPLSNALFGRETSRTWILNADNEFLTTWANLPSFAATHGPLTPDACKLDDARRTEIPGSSSQFVQTAGGSYQFVGAIQAEKTSATQPVLCKRNEDPQMEAEFVCRLGQVCVDDTFCHLDTDNDAEPDSDEPAKGYFYKITWGVAAPFDESFTPYIDEDHKAVKFNIQLVGTEGSIWLYNRGGVTGTGVIALENGARDRDVITHFSSRVFNKACIRYDPQYLVKDRDGTKVQDQCVDIIIRDGGSVEFSGSARTESVTTTSTEVSANANW